MASERQLEAWLDDFIHCTVCMEIFSKNFVPQSLSCGHVICSYCRDLLKQKKKIMCPICRTNSKLKNLHTDYHVLSAVDNYLMVSSKAKKIATRSTASQTRYHRTKHSGVINPMTFRNVKVTSRGVVINKTSVGQVDESHCAASSVTRSSDVSHSAQRLHSSTRDVSGTTHSTSHISCTQKIQNTRNNVNESLGEPQNDPPLSGDTQSSSNDQIVRQQIRNYRQMTENTQRCGTPHNADQEIHDDQAISENVHSSARTHNVGQQIYDDEPISKNDSSARTRNVTQQNHNDPSIMENAHSSTSIHNVDQQIHDNPPTGEATYSSEPNQNVNQQRQSRKKNFTSLKSALLHKKLIRCNTAMYFYVTNITFLAMFFLLKYAWTGTSVPFHAESQQSKLQMEIKQEIAAITSEKNNQLLILEKTGVNIAEEISNGVRKLELSLQGLEGSLKNAVTKEAKRFEEEIRDKFNRKEEILTEVLNRKDEISMKKELKDTRSRKDEIFNFSPEEHMSNFAAEYLNDLKQFQILIQDLNTQPTLHDIMVKVLHFAVGIGESLYKLFLLLGHYVSLLVFAITVFIAITLE